MMIITSLLFPQGKQLLPEAKPMTREDVEMNNKLATTHIIISVFIIANSIRDYNTMDIDTCML